MIMCLDKRQHDHSFHFSYNLLKFRFPLVPINSFRQIRYDFIQGNPHLFGCIAIPHRHSSVLFNCFEVNRDAEGNTHFIGTAVASSNGTTCVPLTIPARTYLIEQFPRGFDKRLFIFDQWQYSTFNWCNRWVEFEKGTFLTCHLVLAVG